MLQGQRGGFGLLAGAEKLKNQYKPMYVYVYTYKNTEKVNFH